MVLGVVKIRGVELEGEEPVVVVVIAVAFFE